MATRSKTLTAAMAVTAMALLAGTANAALITEDFQSPSYPNNTGNPSFTGWTWSNGSAVKSRVNPATSDLPGGAGNQAIQLEWESAKANYVVSAPTWNPGDVFMLSLDVAPQSWNGGSYRTIEPSLTQGATTWSAVTTMATYSGSPVWEPMQYFIPTTGFNSGTDVTLQIAHSLAPGTQRGIYFDNVSLTVGAPPPDNTPPNPDPSTWQAAPVAFDYTNAAMTASTATDPNAVEYLFENITTGATSGWQDSNYWSQHGLAPTTTYAYRTKTRDKSANQNETAWSLVENATTPTAPDGLIFASSFQFPELPSNTANPDFFGWQWVNGGNVKSRNTAGQSDLPGDATNQAIQFEWTNAEAIHDTSHAWSALDMYTLSLNASPQSWNGGEDRYVVASLLQQDGTQLWTDSVLLPHYDNFGAGDWLPELTFSWEISASDFTAGTEGELLRLRIASSGFRGIYVDNVMLTGTVIPEPSSALLALLALVGLLMVRRKRS